MFTLFQNKGLNTPGVWKYRV